MKAPEPRLVRRPRWRRDEDGNISFWDDRHDRWQRMAGWTGDVLAALERGASLAEMTDLAVALKLGSRPERKLREFLYTLARFGYVEIPWDEPPAVYADRYERLKELGRGGVGIADLARDRDSGRLVVVKRAWSWLLPAEVTEAAMRRERDVMARLAHPGIVALLGAFERDGALHLVREYVEGDDLLQFQHRGVAQPAELRRIATEIADVLGHLHARGFLLLDLRPANFLLEEPGGRVRLLDVGQCRELVDGRVQLAAPTGSKGFMSPEVEKARVATVASDVWGFGRLLSFLATGALPFHAPDAAALATSLGAHPLRDAVARLAADDPAARPRSMPEAAGLLA